MALWVKKAGRAIEFASYSFSADRGDCRCSKCLILPLNMPTVGVQPKPCILDKTVTTGRFSDDFSTARNLGQANAPSPPCTTQLVSAAQTCKQVTLLAHKKLEKRSLQNTKISLLYTALNTNVTNPMNMQQVVDIGWGQVFPQYFYCILLYYRI